MSDENSAASTTAGASSTAVATNMMSPQELAASSSTTAAWAAWGRGARTNLSRWAAKNPTGAFESSTVSFRYSTKEYSWGEVAWSLSVLYGGFIGLPVAGGLWSVWRIGSIVGWW